MGGLDHLRKMHPLPVRVSSGAANIPSDLTAALGMTAKSGLVETSVWNTIEYTNLAVDDLVDL